MMMERLIAWRKSQGLEQTAYAVAATVAATRNLPGNGNTWEEISGPEWDNDENDQQILRIGASTFAADLEACYNTPCEGSRAPPIRPRLERSTGVQAPGGGKLRIHIWEPQRPR